jgi:hypothetical protein
MPEPIAPVHERLYHDDFISHRRRQANRSRGPHGFATSGHVRRHGLGSSPGPLDLVARKRAGGSLDRPDAMSMRRWFGHAAPSQSEPSGRLQKLVALLSRTRQRLTAVSRAVLTRLPIIAPLCRIAVRRFGLPVTPGRKRNGSRT